MALLARMRGVAGHTFLPDDVQLVTGEDQVDTARVLTYRMVTDAHLLALARRHGACLATLDRGVKSWPASTPTTSCSFGSPELCSTQVLVEPAAVQSTIDAAASPSSVLAARLPVRPDFVGLPLILESRESPTCTFSADGFWM
jgi:hypothetical protein